MIALLFFMLACGEEDVTTPEIQNRDIYMKALDLSTSDPAASLELCQRITDLSLAGECTMFTAKALANTGGDGVAACETLEHRGWQEVCFFEIVDSSGMKGQTAIDACLRTGSFQERCLAHALHREELSIARQFEAGKEAEMMVYIREMVDGYGLTDITEENIDVKIAARVISNRLFGQARTHSGWQTFSPSFCGTATAPACTEAYRLYVLKAAGTGQPDTPTNCTMPMAPDTIQAMGLPIWTPEFQEQADEVWTHLCKRNRGNQQPPDHAHSKAGQTRH